MKKTVLMCLPKFFQIEYEINPWMHVENRVVVKEARREFENLVATYKRLGVKVDLISPQKGLPDMVFTANVGFVIDKMFIRANFRYEQRRKEAKIAQDYFAQKGFTVRTLPDGVFFEGQGDMFYDGEYFYCGYGKRTAKRAIKYLEKFVGTKIMTLQTRDPYYYHLDTCFAPLGNRSCIIKPSSFGKGDLVKIKKHFSYVIEAGEKDNAFFACNAVRVGETVVVGKGVGKRIKGEFGKLGLTTVEVAMKEFLKSGGAVKCLTQEYFVRGK